MCQTNAQVGTVSSAIITRLRYPHHFGSLCGVFTFMLFSLLRMLDFSTPTYGVNQNAVCSPALNA